MIISLKRTALVALSSTSIFLSIYFLSSKLVGKTHTNWFSMSNEVFSNKSEQLSYELFASTIQCSRANKSTLNSSELEQKAKDYMSEQRLVERTRECSNYFAEIDSHGFSPSTKEETETPIAFTIKVHKEIGILEMFMALYFRPSDAYCIHVDAKAGKEVFAAVKGMIKCYNQMFPQSAVFMPRQAIPVFWGAGGSILEADWICYRELYELGSRWKYLTSGAGTELPLVSIQRLRHVLQRYGGYLLMINDKNGNPDRQLHFWEMHR